jgi:hypothetical protein
VLGEAKDSCNSSGTVPDMGVRAALALDTSPGAVSSAMQKRGAPVGYGFFVSKARGPDGTLLVLGSRRAAVSYRFVTLDRLVLTERNQMWARVPPDPNDPKTFGLHNLGCDRWMGRIPVTNFGSVDSAPIVGRLRPTDGYGINVRWHDDKVAGPYNALVSAENWERKINIMGDGPYREGSEVIMWRWSGGAANELWRFWDVAVVPQPGARVLLTNFEHVVQLGATPETKVYMHANKDTWERWTVEDAGNGRVFLRSAHGTYLGSRANGEVYVTPNRDSWERWIISFNDGFRIRSAEWNLNLGSRPDGSIYTHANCREWERWWTPAV